MTEPTSCRSASVSVESYCVLSLYHPLIRIDWRDKFITSSTSQNFWGATWKARCKENGNISSCMQATHTPLNLRYGIVGRSSPLFDNVYSREGPQLLLFCLEMLHNSLACRRLPKDIELAKNVKHRSTSCQCHTPASFIFAEVWSWLRMQEGSLGIADLF